MAIVSAIYLRVTHTGVLANGRPNPSSVTLYDLDEPIASSIKARYIPIPPNTFVDIPMSTRTFISYTKGSIREFLKQKQIEVDLRIQLRDFEDGGGPLKEGQEHSLPWFHDQS